MRRALNSLKAEDAVEQILNMFSRTKNNAEFYTDGKKTEIFINSLHLQFQYVIIRKLRNSKFVKLIRIENRRIIER